MATIITKNSSTPSQVPSSLIQGELAINVVDGKLYYGSGSGNVVKEFTGSGGGGGSTNTGSLLTTASVSLNTITFTKGDGSTFPITVNTGSGGGGSTFPYTGSAIISGSLTVTGSLEVRTGGQKSISTTDRELYASNGVKTVDWTGQALYKFDTSQSLNWQQRRLYNSNEHVTVFWDTGTLNSGSTSVDWFNKALYDSSTTSSVDWEGRVLYDSSTSSSVNWQLRQLNDSVGGSSVDWDARRLFTPNGTRAFEYGYTDYTSRSNVYHQQNVLTTEQESLSNTNLEYSGYTIEATVDVTPAVGDLIYLNTDGIWYVVDQSTDTSTKLLGVNIDGTNVLLEGDITLNNINLPDHGLPLYIRQGNGRTLSSTIPTSGYVRVIGHCYYQNGTTSTQWIVKFRPSNDWYEI